MFLNLKVWLCSHYWEAARVARVGGWKWYVSWEGAPSISAQQALYTECINWIEIGLQITEWNMCTLCTASGRSVKSNENQSAFIFAHTLVQSIATRDECETIAGTHWCAFSHIVHKYTPSIAMCDEYETITITGCIHFSRSNSKAHPQQQFIAP